MALMTPAQIETVQTSFEAVFLRKAEIAGAFYAHLFRAMPEARELFSRDMHHQREVFASMLAITVRLLNRPGELSEVVDRLAQVHGRFTIAPDQFALAGTAIVAAFRDVLQDRFTPDVEQAWKQATQELVSRVARQLPG